MACGKVSQFVSSFEFGIFLPQKHRENEAIRKAGNEETV
jgi:hypothetical protein